MKFGLSLGSKNQEVGIFLDPFGCCCRECERKKGKRKSGNFKGVFELACSGFTWFIEQENCAKFGAQSQALEPAAIR